MRSLLLFAGAGLVGTMAQAGEGRPARCLRKVEHRTYLDGQCTFSEDADGSFYIELPLAEYFVYVSIVKPGVAEGWWNEHPAARRTHASLGLLHRDGACWVNDANDQVCAW